ncbi:alpha/beta hydrolase [Streptomyces lunaelactis]|uniref:alpha/beta hydrolase family protein n=1 Tax=Streptomyces lunaelactis TaxID=1535768 RepID=UPI001585B3A4|nr:alpha/beta hydrolase [Streptomyces lunaelactis]NUJ99880.1 alpha/beta hydrolase [Streptomyces lunaelactis]NUK07107.1 alpha/beta hydrolase [Streptomyces lunaelactis]NUK15299.1 alpha/beta hydrolase [Streptomyces lunaelactis]NUK32846.1 alpha/beta hydrolase [Streptomyces lunaelactis]NUK39749.1 alpha/beta hydrolase [Streptomyces lunaelactis]
MNRARHGAIAAALVLALAGAGTAFAAPQPANTTQPANTAPSAPLSSESKGVQLQLPRPTGPYAVGRGTLHLVDTSRRDPWVPMAGARELMVSMYYPARRGTGAAAPYMTREGARLFLESRELDGVVPAEVLSGTRTHSFSGARPAPGRFPLVVLSPGFSVPRTTISALAEDLTSRGYVVTTVDHAYEAVGVAFPGGRTLPCAACGRAEEVGLDSVAKGRARDLSFVLDQLTGRHPAWRHAGMIDQRRIGMAGHSMGGMSTAATMAADTRVRAGVNMDGPFGTAPPGAGLGGRAFMMLGTEADHSPGGEDATWDRAWRRLDGWKRWLTVAGSGHFAFTDLPVLGAQLGLNDSSEPLPGQRAGEITRDYVGAFFDLHLRGIAQPLLNGPSAANPEVTPHNGS